MKYIEKLRNSGLRPTKQRLQICEVLFDTEKTFHFTINELDKKIKKQINNKISLFPDLTNKETLWTLLIIPLAVQWWSSWYPGAEPGGGGYIAQRMLAAKNEKHALGATLFFNIMH
mgnify:CR=1 FL=1